MNICAFFFFLLILLSFVMKVALMNRNSVMHRMQSQCCDARSAVMREKEGRSGYIEERRMKEDDTRNEKERERSRFF